LAAIALGSGVVLFATGQSIAAPTTDPMTGRTYTVVENAISWTAAQAAAVAAGGQLAAINSAEEQAFVAGLLASDGAATGSYWVGLQAPYTSWVSGEPVTYANWNPGQPDNQGGVENSVAILWNATGTASPGLVNGAWNDEPEAGYATYGLPEVALAGYVIEQASVAAVPLPPAVATALAAAPLALAAGRRLRRTVAA
jgi:hypothetical protein